MAQRTFYLRTLGAHTQIAHVGVYGITFVVADSSTTRRRVGTAKQRVADISTRKCVGTARQRVHRHAHRVRIYNFL